jgi:hypothetical protein
MYGKEPGSQDRVKRRVLAGNKPSDSIKMGISCAAEQLLSIQSFVVRRVQNLLSYSHFC